MADDNLSAFSYQPRAFRHQPGDENSMSQTVPELLHQGLIMTALGMGLVFAALALLWGIMTLMTRLLKSKPESQEAEAEAGEIRPGPVTAAQSEPSPEDMLTAQRARVAAIATGVLMANALPRPFDVPARPDLEQGQVAPVWVAANRARALHAWQPHRAAEPGSPE